MAFSSFNRSALQSATWSVPVMGSILIYCGGGDAGGVRGADLCGEALAAAVDTGKTSESFIFADV